MDCLFCKIIEGSAESYTLYEDEVVKVFLDAYPDSTGHMLIVPKKHIVDLYDMDSSTWDHMLGVAQKFRRKVEENLHPDGVALLQNNGDLQLIKHFHLHLKPHYKEDPKKDKEEVYALLKED